LVDKEKEKLSNAITHLIRDCVSSDEINTWLNTPPRGIADSIITDIIEKDENPTCMKRVITKVETERTIPILNVNKGTPTFAYRHGDLKGMIVCERHNDRKWILRTGGANGCNGYFDTYRECIEDAENYGYKFYINS
jgi:hypothetical protein